MDVISQLKKALGPQAILTGDDISSRSTSFWDSAPMRARAIARPCNTEEVSSVLRICHESRTPVVVQGGKTGCAQGANSQENEIVLSLELMNKIETIDTTERTATVQAGCILQNLQEAAAQESLLFALDLGARGSCSVGGNIATNAGGVNVLRYGMTREQILGVEAVLSSGEVVSSMNTLIKNNAGFDLKHLFIGTEGALGIVTRAVVRLREREPIWATALVAVDTFEEMLIFFRECHKRIGETMTSFEMMYGDYYDAVTENGGHPPILDQGQPFYVIVEATGRTDLIETTVSELVESSWNKGIVKDGAIAKSSDERSDMWRIRENFEPILDKHHFYLYDIGVPLTLIEGYISNLRSALSENWPGTLLYVLGHIGDSNLHLFISQPEVQTPTKEAVDLVVYELLGKLGGTISAEHGIGFEKKNYLSISRNSGEISLMKNLKSLLDPNNILNRGRVFDN